MPTLNEDIEWGDYVFGAGTGVSAGGTSCRDILETTRRALAEKYLRYGDFSQAEVVFMAGFSDQSSFARAFTRWAGMSPGKFQKVA